MELLLEGVSSISLVTVPGKSTGFTAQEELHDQTFIVYVSVSPKKIIQFYNTIMIKKI